MTPHIKLEQFSGPLDLLLSLIHEEKLDVSEVALSQVTEQYLNYLDTLEETNPHELADFLVIASRLLYLKSRLLLPQLTPDEEEGMSLEDQLRLYRHFVEVSKKVNALWLDSKKSYGRIEPPHVPDTFTPPENFDHKSLHEHMVQLIGRIAPPKPIAQARIDRTVSMKEKIDVLRKLLKQHSQVSFKTLLSSSESRTEIIVSFLAILELVKQQNVFLKQDKFGDDIVISNVH